SVGRRRDRSRRRWRARGMRAAAGERRAVEGDAPDGRSPGAAARHRARGPRLGARSLRGSAARARRHAPHAGGMNLREFNEGKATEMTMHNTPTARFLMCRPEHFAVSYTINPWMNPMRWARDAGAHAAAEREWTALHRKLVEPDAAAAHAVADMFARDVVALELADERFYHMDTALAPLPGGEVMYLPSAFTAAANAAIRERVAPQARIEIASEDGRRFAANAVGL